MHLGFVHLGCLGNEVRAAEPYFDKLTPKPDPEAVALASELIKRMSGRFEPEKMPDEYSRAVRELVKAKVEHRAPEVMIEADGKPKAPAGGPSPKYSRRRPSRFIRPTVWREGTKADS